MRGSCKGQTETPRAMVEVVKEGDDGAPRPCSQELLSSTRVLPKLKGKHGALHNMMRETSCVSMIRAAASPSPSPASPPIGHMWVATREAKGCARAGLFFLRSCAQHCAAEWCLVLECPGTAALLLQQPLLSPRVSYCQHLKQICFCRCGCSSSCRSSWDKMGCHL